VALDGPLVLSPAVDIPSSTYHATCWLKPSLRQRWRTLSIAVHIATY
jgi:hypothetical protein